MNILVTYASKHGSTEEVARSVAGHLRTAGLDVTLLPAAAVDELDHYDGVVLGGAIYMGRLLREARRMLKRLHLPFAVFAMGPLTMEESQVAGSRKQLGAALARAHAEPFAIAIFGGVIHQDEQHFPFSHMPEGDARDWDAIRVWADEVAQAFLERNPVSADSTRSGSVARL